MGKYNQEIIDIYKITPTADVEKVFQKFEGVNKDGYWIYTRLNDLRNNYKPLIHHPSNPKTLENIAILMAKENCKLLSTNYEGRKQKLVYIATCGHKNEITFSHFKAGSGRLCKKCVGNKKLDIDEIKKYFEKEKCALLTTEYTNVHNKLDYIAQCNHQNKITFNHFYRGHGRLCPLCANASESEKIINEWLLSNNFIFQREVTFINLNGYTGYSLRFDFGVYDDTQNIICLIEYDGEQHFKENSFYYQGKIIKDDFQKRQKYDNLKNEYCEKNGIKLIRIPYWEKDNIKHILKEGLL